MRHLALIVTCLLVMLTTAPPARADTPTAGPSWS